AVCRPPRLHSFPTRRSSDLTLRVPRRVAVHLVDGVGEALDRLLEGRLEVLVEPGVLDGGGGAGGHHAQHLALSFVEALARREGRSEEHTSELQSREKLVCRL